MAAIKTCIKKTHIQIEFTDSRTCNMFCGLAKLIFGEDFENANLNRVRINTFDRSNINKSLSLVEDFRKRLLLKQRKESIHVR